MVYVHIKIIKHISISINKILFSEMVIRCIFDFQEFGLTFQVLCNQMKNVYLISLGK